MLCSDSKPMGTEMNAAESKRQEETPAANIHNQQRSDDCDDINTTGSTATTTLKADNDKEEEVEYDTRRRREEIRERARILRLQKKRWYEQKVKQWEREFHANHVQPKGPSTCCDVRVQFCDKNKHVKDEFGKEDDIYVLLTFANHNSHNEKKRKMVSSVVDTSSNSTLSSSQSQGEDDTKKGSILLALPNEILKAVLGFCGWAEHGALSACCKQFHHVLKSYVYLYIRGGHWCHKNQRPQDGRRGICMFVEGCDRNSLPRGRSRERVRVHAWVSRRAKRKSLQEDKAVLAPGESHTFFKKLCRPYSSYDNFCVAWTPEEPGVYTARVLVPTGPDGEENYTLPNRFEFRIVDPTDGIDAKGKDGK